MKRVVSVTLTVFILTPIVGFAADALPRPGVGDQWRVIGGEVVAVPMRPRYRIIVKIPGRKPEGSMAKLDEIIQQRATEKKALESDIFDRIIDPIINNIEETEVDPRMLTFLGANSLRGTVVPDAPGWVFTDLDPGCPGERDEARSRSALELAAALDSEKELPPKRGGR